MLTLAAADLDAELHAVVDDERDGDADDDSVA